MVIYYGVTNNPKLSGIKKQPICHAHRFCKLVIWTRHSGDGLFLLHDVWGFSWDDLKLGSVGTVDHGLSTWLGLPHSMVASGTSYMMIPCSKNEYPSQQGRNFMAFYDLAMGFT